MKKFFFLAAAFVAGIGAMAQQKIDEVAKVNAEKYDFGKIKQGVPVTTFFSLTNTSNAPIVIESATASCGCTTPEWSKEPIAPGATTKIKVGYNAGAVGHFDKPVTIRLAGVADQKVVMITGEVVNEAPSSNNATAEVKPTTPKVIETTQVKPVEKTKVKVKATKTKASK